MNKFYLYNAQIIRILDGDTVEAIVELGFNTSIKTKFRLTGFDAPETYRPKNNDELLAGMKATNALEVLLLNRDVVIYCKKFGKYRYLATIYANGNMQVSVNQQMIDLGHTKEAMNE